MATLHLSAAKFGEVIASDKPVLVDFWATWCRPCMMMTSVVDELAEIFDGQAIIAKLDVDSEGANEIYARYGITNIPNFKLFKNGVEIGNVVGAVPIATLRSLVEKHI